MESAIPTKLERSHFLLCNHSQKISRTVLKHDSIDREFKRFKAKHIMIVADSCFSGQKFRDVESISPGRELIDSNKND